MQLSVTPAMNETDWIYLFTNRTSIQELQETESIRLEHIFFLDGQPERYHVQIVTKFGTILVDVFGNVRLKQCVHCSSNGTLLLPDELEFRKIEISKKCIKEYVRKKII